MTVVVFMLCLWQVAAWTFGRGGDLEATYYLYLI
jgi:hypothetical protein